MYNIAEEIEVTVNAELKKIEMKRILLSLLFCQFTVFAQDDLLNYFPSDDANYINQSYF